MTIQQAIDRSSSHNEIVTCSAALPEIEALCAQADGSADVVSQYGHYDVWGHDDDGAEWRLHIEIDNE